MADGEDNAGMVLEYLDFDLSENGDGGACWDAMACVLPGRLAAALREADAVLVWAHTEWSSPGEEGEWDFDLQCQQDGAQDLGAAFDPEAPTLHCSAPAMDGGRCTLTLTLSGTAAFGAALQERFSID